MGGKAPDVPITAEERQLASIAQEQWADSQKRFGPVMEKVFKIAGNKQGRQAQAENMASIGTKQAFERARPGLEAGLARKGASPGSGAFDGAVTNFSLDQAQSQGANMTDAAQRSNDNYYRGLDAIVNIGRGKSAQAIGGLGSVASQANEQAIADAQASAGNRAALVNAVGTGAGIYAAYGTGGTPAETDFTNPNLKEGDLTYSMPPLKRRAVP